MIACAPLPLELAITKAISERTGTSTRSTNRVSFSVAFLRKKGLYKSAVEIEAAIIAASSSQQIPAGKNLRAIAMKTSF